MKSILHREAEATYNPQLHENAEPELSQKASNRVGIILIGFGVLLFVLGSGLPAVVIIIAGNLVILDGYLMAYLQGNKKQ